MDTRTVPQIIDAMYVVMPEGQDEFVAQLELIVDADNAVGRGRNPNQDAKIQEFNMNRLLDVLEQYIPTPTETWHFQLASVIFNKPVGIIKEFNARYEATIK